MESQQNESKHKDIDVFKNTYEQRTPKNTYAPPICDVHIQMRQYIHAVMTLQAHICVFTRTSTGTREKQEQNVPHKNSRGTNSSEINTHKHATHTYETVTQ